jgi:hypothetical protein
MMEPRARDRLCETKWIVYPDRVKRVCPNCGYQIKLFRKRATKMWCFCPQCDSKIRLRPSIGVLRFLYKRRSYKAVRRFGEIKPAPKYKHAPNAPLMIARNCKEVRT